uniref:MULE transposase domain-containing protein n=1 Tax=Peronospora matthiolae TaxID=2874970 RepID=A0AAV1UBI0_9STRA
MEKRFHSLFIAPGATRYAFQHIRYFVAVNGTSNKTRYVQILLLAVSMDAQDELAILRWAVVPNECEETWDWFLTSLRKAHFGVNERGSVLTKHGIVFKRLFWKCVYANKKADFDKFIDQIRQIRPLAADYTTEILHSQWATYALDFHHFEEVTSSLAETAKSFFEADAGITFSSDDVRFVSPPNGDVS